MRRALIPIAAVLFLLDLPLQAAEPGDPKCTEYGRSEGRICSRIDASTLRNPGDSTTWRVWLEGGGEPIDVRLHNGSPGVVRVKGGEDQTVHMGCRWHREVRRKVTLIAPIAPGEPLLQAGLRSPSPRQEAAGIAVSLLERLKRVEAAFLSRRDDLPAAPSSDAVKTLLDRTEADLLEALSYEELAALRDYVREKFRSLSVTDFPQKQAVYASLSTAVPESALDRALGVIRRLIELAQNNDLVVDLCVVSEPRNRARFIMRPWSLNRIRETYTTGEIAGLYRGLYVYRVTRGLGSFGCMDPVKDQCAAIDLVDDPSKTYQCDLERRACRRLRDLPPGGCRD
jgi:hypothetical protein